MLLEVKSVNKGATSAASAGGIGVVEFSVPSKWHVLQNPLPRNRFQPANSSGVNTGKVGLARAKSNFELNGLTSGPALYAAVDCAAWSKAEITRFWSAVLIRAKAPG